MPDETNDAEPLNEPSDSSETQAPPTLAPKAQSEADRKAGIRLNMSTNERKKNR
jgi:hypothetical protein